MPSKEQVAIIGSGNWGTVLARICAINAKRHPAVFHQEIRMYCYEEEHDGRLLHEIVNEDHENPKYLPGLKLPNNVVADPSPVSTIKDATLIVFVTPVQFVRSVCEQMRGHILPEARAISGVKGLEFSEYGPILVSEIISSVLNIDVSVLMGANIASEIAEEQFCEATIGSTNSENALIFKLLFETPYMLIEIVQDVASVELCGSLKQIVGLAAGFADGLGLGSNTKAAIIRIGLMEMRNFARYFFRNIPDQAYLESCGVADLITTCYGGRHRLCGQEFVRTGKRWEVLERELFLGQKVEGTEMLRNVYRILAAKKLLARFPLFQVTYLIAFEGLEPSHLTQDIITDDDARSPRAKL